MFYFLALVVIVLGLVLYNLKTGPTPSEQTAELYEEVRSDTEMDISTLDCNSQENATDDTTAPWLLNSPPLRVNEQA